MKSFLARFGALIHFVLSGFDRLRFCGESRLLHHPRGGERDLSQQRVLFKDFPGHAQLERGGRDRPADAGGGDAAEVLVPHQLAEDL